MTAYDTGAVNDADVLALEEAAFASWPAEEVVALGPWRMRAMRGVTGRGNSTWAGPGAPPRGLPAAIEEVERFYAARGLPALFHLTSLSDPRLEPLLAARGYALVDPVSLQVADTERVAQLAPRAGVTARCDSSLPEDWFEVSGRRGRFHGEASDVYRGLLARVDGRAGFASASAERAELAAVGLTVVAPPLAGVFSMLTLPEQRKRGLGAAVLGELARFALARGAQRLYLQVDRANAAAIALYARAGFREHHGYHYRRRV